VSGTVLQNLYGVRVTKVTRGFRAFTAGTAPDLVTCGDEPHLPVTVLATPPLTREIYTNGLWLQS